jgi:RNA polymerase sigma-70 factor (ECF subfamily)
MDIAPCPDEASGSLEYLVARIARGDSGAERAFVERFQPGVTALARRHARPHESRTADVVQNVLWHVLQRLRNGEVREAKALPAYLRTCVTREVAALYGDAEYRLLAGADGGGALEALASADDPEARAARHDHLLAVRQAMDSLPVPRDREVLVRFYVREESREAICQALGIDTAHFRRVLFRARDRLMQQLAPELREAQ